jgi:hypothetical protein
LDFSKNDDLLPLGHKILVMGKRIEEALKNGV